MLLARRPPLPRPLSSLPLWNPFLGPANWSWPLASTHPGLLLRGKLSTRPVPPAETVPQEVLVSFSTPHHPGGQPQAWLSLQPCFSLPWGLPNPSPPHALGQLPPTTLVIPLSLQLPTTQQGVKAGRERSAGQCSPASCCDVQAAPVRLCGGGTGPVRIEQGDTAAPSPAVKEGPGRAGARHQGGLFLSGPRLAPCRWLLLLSLKAGPGRGHGRASMRLLGVGGREWPLLWPRGAVDQAGRIPLCLLSLQGASGWRVERGRHRPGGPPSSLPYPSWLVLGAHTWPHPWRGSDQPHSQGSCFPGDRQGLCLTGHSRPSPSPRWPCSPAVLRP